MLIYLYYLKFLTNLYTFILFNSFIHLIIDMNRILYYYKSLILMKNHINHHNE